MCTKREAIGSRRMELLKILSKVWIAPMLLAAATLAPAAQLSTDARTSIPHEVQQLVVIDYRAMQNSTAAMDLKERVMPPELKQFDEALSKSGLNDNHGVAGRRLNDRKGSPIKARPVVSAGPPLPEMAQND